MPNSREHHCSVTTHDGRVFIIGGESSNKRSVLIFNPKDGSFTDGPTLLYDTDNAVCTLFYSPMHDGRPVILAASGWGSNKGAILDYTFVNVWEECKYRGCSHIMFATFPNL